MTERPHGGRDQQGSSNVAHITYDPSQQEHTESRQHTPERVALNTAEMAGLFRGAIQKPFAHWSGKQLGPWRLVRPLGQGGMGAVWLGERCDEAFRMRVAIKLLENPLADKPAIERFRRERQFLADLKHPNIAVLHDGGTTPEGLPYLVMEYVEGQTIDRWCADSKPQLDELLACFDQICSAVSYAHQNGVLHRDIKPHNIMITSHQQPKLLDFGIATDVQLTALTVDGATPMTPAYASPERLHGYPATAAADIYALGLVLLELITGKPPRAPGLNGEALVSLLPEQSTARPQLTRGLRAALEHDPAKRPESVEALRRILTGSEPEHRPTHPTTATTPTRPETDQLGEYLLIPEGPFLMGRTDGEPWEQPQHRLYLPDYYIARYPVTNAQYSEYLAANPDRRAPKNGWTNRRPPQERLDHPVTAVSWFEAVDYCRWLSANGTSRYRLPSEAEWEKAAGGVDGRRYPWGSQWDPKMVQRGNTTTAVTSLQQGPFGCYQMVGFIQEWTSTRWGDDPKYCEYGYPYRSDDGRETRNAAFHIHRGGAYRDPPERLGCRSRGWSNPAGTFNWRGFRVVREI